MFFPTGFWNELDDAVGIGQCQTKIDEYSDAAFKWAGTPVDQMPQDAKDSLSLSKSATVLVCQFFTYTISFASSIMRGLVDLLDLIYQLFMIVWGIFTIILFVISHLGVFVMLGEFLIVLWILQTSRGHSMATRMYRFFSYNIAYAMFILSLLSLLYNILVSALNTALPFFGKLFFGSGGGGQAQVK
jgi:hypothetical protein